MDSGVYIAIFWLPTVCRTQTGRLGRVRFPAGVYLYVGSAQKNLSARIERHGRRRKPLRWHIDYLSTRARMLGAIVFPERSRRRECELAQDLYGLFRLAIPGLEASDCRCQGHLFFAPALP
jgi:sugar fermentation stimulation protein A